MRGVDREGPEQAALVAWSKLQRVPWADGMLSDYLVHVPNGGGKITKREGARLKRMGLRPGVSDLLLALPAGRYHGMWIELKEPKATPSKVTDAQWEWIRLQRAVGFCAVPAFGWDDARRQVEAYLANGPSVVREIQA